MTTHVEALQDWRYNEATDGDHEAMVIEFMRFTQEQHARGETAGWRFEVGWFERASGLHWAWFSREPDREE